MQEHSDINYSAIMKWGIALLVVAFIVHILMYFLFQFLNAQEAKMDPKPSPMFQKDQTPPAPILQTNPALDLQQFRAQEQHLLTSYGWIDKEKGIARIPVGEAMKLVVEKEKTGLETQ
jgi:hypothetical protein